jgi:hypothetical protein
MDALVTVLSTEYSVLGCENTAPHRLYSPGLGDLRAKVLTLLRLPLFSSSSSFPSSSSSSPSSTSSGDRVPLCILLCPVAHYVDQAGSVSTEIGLKACAIVPGALSLYVFFPLYVSVQFSLLYSMWSVVVCMCSIQGVGLFGSVALLE